MTKAAENFEKNNLNEQAFENFVNSNLPQLLEETRKLTLESKNLNKNASLYVAGHP